VYLKTPLKEEDFADSKVNEIVYLTGRIYTARDMAHIRRMEYENEEYISKVATTIEEGRTYIEAGLQ
jgi:tartrate dehydratase beta subunit/fumarate hydratase class I family protein